MASKWALFRFLFKFVLKICLLIFFKAEKGILENFDSKRGLTARSLDWVSIWFLSFGSASQTVRFTVFRQINNHQTSIKSTKTLEIVKDFYEIMFSNKCARCFGNISAKFLKIIQKFQSNFLWLTNQTCSDSNSLHQQSNKQFCSKEIVKKFLVFDVFPVKPKIVYKWWLKSCHW